MLGVENLTLNRKELALGSRDGNVVEAFFERVGVGVFDDVVVRASGRVKMGYLELIDGCPAGILFGYVWLGRRCSSSRWHFEI